MLILRVTSLDGKAPSQAIEATFDEAGGTIGRADDNRLILPDPDRHISRVHARVECKSGTFSLSVQGGNPVEVDGAPILQGESARIKQGGLLRIAGYVIAVLGAQTVDADPPAPQKARVQDVDPFANLLDQRPARPATGGAASSAMLASAAHESPSDPLGLGFQVAAPRSADPGSGYARSHVASGIPEDFDPFADPLAEAPRPPGAGPIPDDLSLGLGGLRGPDASIDALFDLPARSGVDPLAGSALAQPPAGRASAGGPSLDPLAPWQGQARAVSDASSAPDETPEIQGSFRLPRPQTATTPPPAAAPDGDVFLSWDDDDDEASHSASESGATAKRAEPDPLLGLFGESVPSAPTHDPLGLGGNLGTSVATGIAAPEPKSAPSAPPRVHALEQTRTADADALSRAFMAGLGTSTLQPVDLTPEMMQRIGELVREATQGTIDLLIARAMTKREVRADMTLIVAKGNNPLKFSPNVGVALAHLLAPPRAGFLPPVAAMRDAYADLRTHQFGFMAGLRAALAGVLRRFDPTVLEKRLVSNSVFDSVVPMSRRAKLWDLYERLYREIAVEAEDDFHTLFGREFLRAYEEQVARLADGDDGANAEHANP